MTFADHGVHYGALLGIASKAGGMPDDYAWAMFAAGFLLGAWPDICISVYRVPKAFKHHYEWRIFYDWDKYAERHTARNPLYWLHQLVDAPFHKIDGSWWPKLWPLALAYWLVEVAAILVMVRL